MKGEGFFEKDRVIKAAKAAGVVFVLVLLIFLGMQLMGVRISGNDVLFLNSIWMAILLGVVSFLGMIFLMPRVGFNPENEKYETAVEEMEEFGESHKHAESEMKEEDVLNRLKKSHEPTESAKKEDE